MSDDKENVTIDGATGLPEEPKKNKDGKPRRRIDLSNLRDVRIEMAYIYREMDAGMIEASEGTKKVFVLDCIGKIITVADYERRLTELEDKQRLPATRPFGLFSKPSLSKPGKPN